MAKANKYRAIKSEYNGIVFASKKEKEYAVRLDICKKTSLLKERVIEYQTQVKYPIIVNNQKICTYILDFIVHYGDGRIEYVDVKGFITPVYRIKKKLVEAIFKISILEK
jgi:hypothetical protein